METKSKSTRPIEEVRRLAREAAERIVPNCLSRTCFIESCGHDECWGCDDQNAERERVASIIEPIFAGTEVPAPQPNECICPVVEVRCATGQVSDVDMREIANALRAQVSRILLDTDEGRIGLGSTLWGKHRSDCPCGPPKAT